MNTNNQLDKDVADFRDFKIQPAPAESAENLPAAPTRLTRRVVSKTVIVVASTITIAAILAIFLFLQNHQSPSSSNLPPHQGYPAKFPLK